MFDETGIGGPHSGFPATRWTAIERVRSDDPEERRLAHQALIEAYWKPVYKYLRIRWRRSNEAAKDLTQEFFTRLIEKEFLDGFDPARARLRTYLRVCVDRLVQNEDRAAQRLKRGGDVQVLSLDFAGAEGELERIEPVEPTRTEDLFEREWIRSIFATAVDRLELDCRARDRQLDFRLFERYDLADEVEKAPTYAELAAENGLTVTAVTNRLAATRRRFRRLVLDRLWELTGSEAEFRQEARSLLGRETA